MKNKLLEVKEMGVQFKLSYNHYFNAVNNVSFSINEGEILGFVGESGSGKTSTGKSIIGINNISSGNIFFDGKAIASTPLGIKKDRKEWMVKDIQMIFQNPLASLNSKTSIRKSVLEGYKNSFNSMTSEEKELILIESFIIENNLSKENLNKFKILKKMLLKLVDTKKNYLSKLSKITSKLDVYKNIKKNNVKTLRKEINDIQTLFTISKSEGNKPSKSKLNDFKIEHKKYFKISNKKLKVEIYHLKEKLDIFLKQNKKIQKIKEKELSIEVKKYKKNIFSSIEKKTWIEKISDTFKKTNTKVLDEKIENVFKQVSLSLNLQYNSPENLSGGQAQRVALARALLMEPKLIIADEPIAALDVSIQAQVINLLKKIIKDTNTSMLFIAHDLQMVKHISDRIIVMYKGNIVEEGLSSEIYDSPQHPYTKALINAIPSIDNPSKIDGVKEYKEKIKITYENFDKIKMVEKNITKTHKTYSLTFQK